MVDRRGPVLSRRHAGLLAASAAALAAWGPGASFAADGVLNVAQGSDVPTLDPTVDTSPIGLNVRKNIFSQLTNVNRKGEVVPELATAWSSAENTTVWTFTIRKNAKFHDGSPVRIEDIIWTYKKVMEDKKSPVNSYLSKIKTIEKEGEDKIKITLIEPFAPFDRQVTLIGVAPQKAYETMGPVQFAQTPVGSGPYKVLRWVKDDRVELEAFNDYFDGAPKIKRVNFKPVPTDASRVAALISGELDVVPLLPPAMIDRLSRASGIKVAKVESYKAVYMGLDILDPLLSDIRIRQAIDVAIDRESITTKLLRGMGKPVGQVVTPVTFGYDPTLAPTAYDAEKAKALVKESGYKGDKIPLEYPIANFASADEVAQAVAGYLTAVGINVELKPLEYSAFFGMWATAKLPGIHLFTYGPTALDADLPISSLYESGRARTKWVDPKIDELCRAQRAEGDPAKRKALIGQIWRLSREKIPYVTLYSEIQAYGVRDSLAWEPWPNAMLIFN